MHTSFRPQAFIITSRFLEDSFSAESIASTATSAAYIHFKNSSLFDSNNPIIKICIQ